MYILLIGDTFGVDLLQDCIKTSCDYEAAVVHSSSEALDSIKKRRPNLVVLDALMPETAKTVQTLQKNFATNTIPILLSMTSPISQLTEEQKSLELNVLSNPIQDIVKLVETLNKVASGICQTQLSILLFEENQENIDTALKQLQPLNCQIEPVHDVSLLLKKTMELYPDLVVMHYSKRALIQELKNSAKKFKPLSNNNLFFKMKIRCVPNCVYEGKSGAIFR